MGDVDSHAEHKPASTGLLYIYRKRLGQWDYVRNRWMTVWPQIPLLERREGGYWEGSGHAGEPVAATAYGLRGSSWCKLLFLVDAGQNVEIAQPEGGGAEGGGRNGGAAVHTQGMAGALTRAVKGLLQVTSLAEPSPRPPATFGGICSWATATVNTA